MTDEEIDLALLANVTANWRKVALVIGSTMMQLDEQQQREGRNDLYFARRVSLLAERGLLEYEGDLREMGRSQVRLPPEADGFRAKRKAS